MCIWCLVTWVCIYWLLYGYANMYTYTQRWSMCKHMHIQVPAYIHVPMEVNTCVFMSIHIYTVLPIHKHTQTILCVYIHISKCISYTWRSRNQKMGCVSWICYQPVQESWTRGKKGPYFPILSVKNTQITRSQTPPIPALKLHVTWWFCIYKHGYVYSIL